MTSNCLPPSFFLFHFLAHSGAKLQNEPNKPSPGPLGVLSANKRTPEPFEHVHVHMVPLPGLNQQPGPCHGGSGWPRPVGKQTSRMASSQIAHRARRRLFCTWYQVIPRGYSGLSVRDEGEGSRFGVLQPALKHYRALNSGRGCWSSVTGAGPQCTLGRTRALSRGLHGELSAGGGGTVSSLVWIPLSSPRGVITASNLQ
ncbi:hypothetical protein EDB80DRAFT_6722 [Ilyonectria destructans]|nr:hypothetical protein EDB80DRAFT_6722 [Ilyonectria destructans]